MNKDYLILIGIGIFGVMIRMLIPGNIKGEVFRMKLHVSMVYIMIMLGICGLILLIIDFF
ncbi:MAG: hypothetical protein KKG93_07265 [Bacteroidetes bacterium]|nr:hypothetical protein [Bacteroidota bacterium]